MRIPLVLLLSAMFISAGEVVADDVTIAVNATIRVVPFTAFSGERNLQITGGNTSRIPLPNHIGCPQDTGVAVADALQKICAPAKAYYSQIGSSGGNRCGYHVYAGVCVSVR